MERTTLRAPLTLYACVVFTSAWLVFWIQPLAVRGLLPALGGSAMVWNTAMVFFQGTLLGGYALAHLLVRRATPTAQIAVLAVLWAGIALSMPIGGIRILGETPGATTPALWLLGTLAGALAPSLLAVSTLTPLVQAWLARAGAGAASADPYFLYAASNAGSVGVLLAYPFLLEPLLGLNRQQTLWSVAALALAPVLMVLWLGARKEHNDERGDAPARTLATVRILTLAAGPSALLLGVTQFLTTDIASVPLLWIVPLALYLASFIHAFARRELIPHRRLPPLIAIGLVGLGMSNLFTHRELAVGGAHLVVFTACALYCHGALAHARPPARDLTRFYLLISTGGLLGGLLVALIAPLVFNDIYEYPLAMAAVATLLPATPMLIGRRHRIAGLAGLALITAGWTTVVLAETNEGEASALHTTGTYMYLTGCAIVTMLSARVFLAHPAWLGAIVGAVLIAPMWFTGEKDEIARERTFFGVYRIDEAGGIRTLHHGTTVHGSQWQDDDGSVESRTSYYAEGGPYADVFHALHRRKSPIVIGIAGLGTGSLACYAQDGDTVRIYEIDPMMVSLARAHFAALDACAPDATIVIGDARLALEAETATLDLLALDTFSSDAIPVHMLTKQALESYLRVLAPDGVIAVHISNRHLDLEPVLAALSDQGGVAALINKYTPEEGNKPPYLANSAIVVAIARGAAVLDALELGDGWRTLERDERVRTWTDDYTSIVPVLR